MSFKISGGCFCAAVERAPPLSPSPLPFANRPFLGNRHSPPRQRDLLFLPPGKDTRGLNHFERGCDALHVAFVYFLLGRSGAENGMMNDLHYVVLIIVACIGAILRKSRRKCGWI